ALALKDDALAIGRPVSLAGAPAFDGEPANARQEIALFVLGCLVGQRGFDPFRIEAPHGAAANIGQPDGGMADADRVAARADELLNHLIAGRIDSRERIAK